MTHDTKDMCGAKSNRGYNMTTASGKPFWPASPRTEDVRLGDIALQLSRVCRFNGAILHHKHYSDDVAKAHVRKYGYYSPLHRSVMTTDGGTHYNLFCQFEVYSVAQHSVHVYEAVAKETDDPEVHMAALMHDAHEYILGDMVKPQKSMYKNRKTWETQMDLCIANKFDFDFELFDHPLIKKADYQAVITEHRDLQNLDGGVDWGVPKEEPWEETIIPMLPSSASSLFLDTYNEISKRRKNNG